jgi:hypothetical protein
VGGPWRDSGFLVAPHTPPTPHPIPWRGGAGGAGVMQCNILHRGHLSSTKGVGAGFTFFNTLQSHPAVVLYVYLLPKSAIRNAQHDLEGIL